MSDTTKKSDTTKRTPEDAAKPVGMKVRWPEKFGDRVVTINANDFDAKVHQRVTEK